MKGIMLNEHLGLETATLKREKTRTSLKEKFCEQAEQDMIIGFVKQKYLNNELHLFTKEETAAVSYKTRYLKNEIVAIKQSYKTIWKNMPCGIEKSNFERKYDFTAGWYNKMFVENEVMPHQIKITDIKLERLQDISDEDCIKEGIRKGKCGNDELGWMQAYYYDKNPFCKPHEAFASLIDKIGGNDTWKCNDLYVVYYYELIK